MQQVKVLLVQLASHGDCLFVTTIAKQIKEVDYPGCHLTWLIGSKFAPVLINNPYVDQVIQIPLATIADIANQRNNIEVHVANAGGYERFGKIFITDVVPQNARNIFGTNRSMLFRNYPHRLKVSPQPLIYLTEAEKSNVKDFCDKHGLINNKFNILFECEPQSGQSLMTLDQAKVIAEQLSAENSELKFILSSGKSFASANPNVIDGSVVTWRENAELANYCHLFIGCSSGISWLCTTNWAKPIPQIQTIIPNYSKLSCSLKVDFKFFNIDNHKLIEMNTPTNKVLADCIRLGIKDFESAATKYDEPIYKVFLDFKLIKDSYMPRREKLLFYLRCFLKPKVLLNYYRSVRPGWLAPGLWIRHLKA